MAVGTRLYRTGPSVMYSSSIATIKRRSPPPAGSHPIGWRLRLAYPLRSTVRRWRGMVGMILGVGIALSLAMTILAISKASDELIVGDYLAAGPDLYIVTEGGTLIPIMPGEMTGTIKNARRVLTQLRAVPVVDTAIGLGGAVVERESDALRRRSGLAQLFSAMGVEGDPNAIAGMLLMHEGRWLRRSDEVVIGSRLSHDRRIELGTTLRLNSHDFTVVGIGRLRGIGPGADTLIYMDYAAMRDRAGTGDVMTSIVVDSAQPAAVRQAVTEIGSLVVADRPELLNRVKQAQATSVAVNWTISLLTLGIGALFVGSMLGRSVIERRLEFATLKAIGLPNRTILLVVILEAVVISLAATLVGIGVSRIFGLLIDAYIAAPNGIATLYLVDLMTVFNVLILALGLGLLAGLLPARRAIGVDPVDILREA